MKSVGVRTRLMSLGILDRLVCAVSSGQPVLDHMPTSGCAKGPLPSWLASTTAVRSSPRMVHVV